MSANKPPEMYESEAFPVRKYLLLTFLRNRVFPLALSSVGDRQLVYLPMIPSLTHAAFESESFPFQCHNIQYDISEKWEISHSNKSPVIEE